MVEYMVAKAVGAKAPSRIEWAPYDVEAPDGTKIEIKASGYSQSWAGPDSTPRFTFKSVEMDQYWDESLGKYTQVEPADRVHVWVFALHETRRVEVYDPLDLDRWSFRVVPHVWLLNAGQRSAGLPFFEKHGIEPVSWADLAKAIGETRVAHDKIRAEQALT
ncbi:MAG: hypothetical protein ACSLFI_10610 [Solirubrobacterales bacterium]